MDSTLNPKTLNPKPCPEPHHAGRFCALCLRPSVESRQPLATPRRIKQASQPWNLNGLGFRGLGFTGLGFRGLGV